MSVSIGAAIEKVSEKLSDPPSLKSSYGGQGPNGGRLMIEIERLEPDPAQPRKIFDTEKLAELVESIKQMGVMVDLVVKLKGRRKDSDPILYEIIDGERRWRAAKLAGLRTVPVSVRNPFDAGQQLAMQLVANMQRENLSALEEAAGLGRRVQDGTKPEELAKELGLSRATVYSRLALTRLTEPVRKALIEGKISTQVAGLVALVPGEPQGSLLKSVTEDRWRGALSVREVKDLIDRDYLKQLNAAGWTFDWVPEAGFCKKIGYAAGHCQGCPKRSGNLVGQFPELASRPNVCTDVNCFGLKTQEWARVKLEEAKRAQQPVLETGQAFEKYGGVKRDYVDLGERCEELGWDHKKNWNQTLGSKDRPQVILAADKEGKLHQLVKRDEAVQALKESGKLKKVRAGLANSGGENQWRKEIARRARLTKLYQKAAYVATGEVMEWLDKPRRAKEQLELARLLARAAYEHTSIDQHSMVAKRMGLTEVQTDCRQKLEKWLKDNGENLDALNRIAAELLLCARWESSSYGTVSWGSRYKEICQLAGVKLPSPKLTDAKKGKGQSKIKSKIKINPPTSKALRRAGKGGK